MILRAGDCRGGGAGADLAVRFPLDRDEGNILNPARFFGDAVAPGGTAAFLSIDMAIAWLVFTGVGPATEDVAHAV